MIHSELMRLFQAAGIFHYDANGVENTGISFANFAGTEIQSELIDKQNVTGPLPFIVDRSLAIIKSLLPVPSNIKGGNVS